MTTVVHENYNKPFPFFLFHSRFPCKKKKKTKVKSNSQNLPYPFHAAASPLSRCARAIWKPPTFALPHTHSTRCSRFCPWFSFLIPIVQPAVYLEMYHLYNIYTCTVFAAAYCSFVLHSVLHKYCVHCILNAAPILHGYACIIRNDGVVSLIFASTACMITSRPITLASKCI